MTESEKWSVVHSRSKRTTTDKVSSTSEPKVTKGYKNRANDTYNKTSTTEKTERLVIQRRRRSDINDTPQPGSVTRNNPHLRSVQWKQQPSQNKSSPSFVESIQQEGRRDLGSSIINIKDDRESQNSTAPTSRIRLLKRPSDHFEQSSMSSHGPSDSSDDKVISKIGKPIIHSWHTQPRKGTAERIGCIATDGFDLERGRNSSVVGDRNNAQWDGEYGSSSIKSGSVDTKMGLERPRRGLLMLKPKPRSPSPPPDLTSDNQWPSISGCTTDDGCGQEEWLSGGPNKGGWSDIVKITPSVKLLMKREVFDPDFSGDEGDCTVKPVAMVTGNRGDGSKEKKKRKKRKSSEDGQIQLQEKKHDVPPILDLSQYMKQVPVRPTLNRKDITPSKELSAARGNVLDSTAPAMRRGKEREEPKTKKPTQLRKVIEKEKAVKKELREKGLTIPPDLDVMKPEPDQSDEPQKSADNDVHSPIDPSPQTTPQTTPTNQPLRQIHGRRFREYCSHMVTDEINSVVEQLLQDLVRFQDRQYQRDPIRARSKRRYVCGLREVHKHLEVGRLKCVIVPPNLDHIQSTGGIDERVAAISSLCRERGVQVVHAMSRRKLAFVLKKKYKIGCVGIFSYDGAEVHYKKMLELVEEASELYRRIAHPQVTEESTTITNTTPDTHSLDSGNSCSDDENGSIPVSRNGTGTQQTGSKVNDTPWKIFFPQQTSKNEDDITVNPTNQITDDITSKPTNHKTEESSTSIQGNKHHTYLLHASDHRHGNACVLTGQQESDFSASTNHYNDNDDIIKKENDVTPCVSFHWNVNAAEFIPS